MEFKNFDFLYTSKDWGYLINKLYNKKIFYLEKDNNKIPYIFHKDFISKRKISLPNSDFSYFSKDSELIFNLQNNINCEQFTIKVLSKNILSNAEKYSNYYYLKIDTYESFLKNTNTNFRRNLKKDIQVYNNLNMKKFYKIYYSTKIKDFEIMPYPYKYFLLLKKKFNENLVMLFSYNKNRILGCSLFLEFKKSLYYIAGASNKSYLPCHHKIFSEIIKIAIKKNIKYIFLGTDANKFKESLGASKLIFNYINLFNSNRSMILIKRKTIQIITKLFVKFFLKFDIGKKYYKSLYIYCK